MLRPNASFSAPFALLLIGGLGHRYYSLSTVFLRPMWSVLGNIRKFIIPCKLHMGKLVAVLKRVDVRGCIACTLYDMYVSVGNSQESVISYELPMG